MEKKVRNLNFNRVSKIGQNAKLLLEQVRESGIEGNKSEI